MFTLITQRTKPNVGRFRISNDGNDNILVHSKLGPPQYGGLVFCRASQHAQQRWEGDMIECSLRVSIPMLVVVGLVGLLAVLPRGSDLL